MMGFLDAVASVDHMQTVCTLLQTPTPHHPIITGRMLFLTPNQQCQSAEGIIGCAEA